MPTPTLLDNFLCRPSHHHPRGVVFSLENLSVARARRRPIVPRCFERKRREKSSRETRRLRVTRGQRQRRRIIVTVVLKPSSMGFFLDIPVRDRVSTVFRYSVKNRTRGDNNRSC